MRGAVWALAGTLAIGAHPAQAAPPAESAASPPILPSWAGSQKPFGWSGSWLFPVGDPLELGRPGPDRSPGFRINRCVGGPEEGVDRHQGADLSCGRGGDPVRAAAHGVVVVAEGTGWHGGYGRHVVIAHRLAEGGLAFSVYAHLADQSLRVKKGQLVAAGQAIGRVGRSGRASSEHLHFEVRLANERDAPWQLAEVLDPITFVADHLPELAPDTGSTAPYLLWADCAAMLETTDHADSTLERATWWRMLAHAARRPGAEVPEGADDLRRTLVSAGVLETGPAAAPEGIPGWAEISADLRRLRKVGVMVPRPPLSPTAHRATCQQRFAAQRPTHALEQLAGRARPPVLEEACLVLADASGSWEVPPKKKPAPVAAAAKPTTAPARPPTATAGTEFDAISR